MIRKNISTVYGPQKVAVPCIEEINAEDGKTETEEEVQIEVSVHSVSSTSYIRELRAVFPNWTIPSSATVITTMQNAAIDLVGIGSQLAEEKDVLLERVMEFDIFLMEQWSSFSDIFAVSSSFWWQRNSVPRWKKKVIQLILLILVLAYRYVIRGAVIDVFVEPFHLRVDSPQGICLDGNIVFNEVQSAQILLGYK